MLYCDLHARQQRRCIASICEQIRKLERRNGDVYEVAMLRARKAELVEELTDWYISVNKLEEIIERLAQARRRSPKRLRRDG